MKSNRFVLKRCAIILAVVISAALFLPKELFAQGAVVGYAWGSKTVTNAQLEKLTYVMAVDLYINTNGSLRPNPDPSINNFYGWLNDLVDRAHAKNVKVSICIGHGEGYDNFNAVTANTTRRQNLVSNIVDFVNDYNLDGVDIDWEYPGNETTDPIRQIAEWEQYIEFLNDLDVALPNKRISVALFRHAPDWWWSTSQYYIPEQIWSTVDAIHLMTYDQNVVHGWKGNHSDATSSKDAIDAWATWGTSGGRNLDKKKLFLGCAFYGWHPNVGGDKKPYATYSAPGFSGNPGDNTTSVAAKVDHCINNGYGGVMIWELGYDDNNSLLNAIWAACPAISGPSIVCYSGNTFTLDPVPPGTITWSVNGYFIVSGNGASATVTRIGSNTSNGMLTAKVNGAVVATKTITACPPPNLTGPSTVCYSGSTFTLDPVPAGAVEWSITGPFMVSGNGLTATVTQTGTGTGNGTLTASIGGLTIAAKNITPCIPAIIGPAEVCDPGSTFTLDPAPQGTITWSATGSFTVSGNGSTATVTRVGCCGGDGVLTASVNGTAVATKAITPCPPFIIGPDIVCSTGSIFTLNPVFPEYILTWSVTGPFTISGYGLSVTVTSTGTITGYGYGTLTVSIYGKTIIASKTITSCPLYTIYSWISSYPNPASSILNIEIDANAQSQSSAPAVTSGKQLKVDKTFDARLYDAQGNLLRNAKTKGGKVEFSVTDLPDGIYYLHIYDGVNAKPEMRQIVVEH